MTLAMRRIGEIYFELLKERRAVCALLLIFGSAHLASAMHFFIAGKATNGARALLLLCILLLLPIAEKLISVRTPPLGYAPILFLIFGSLLGSCYNFYFRVSFWDTLLHVLSGFIFACIGYAICKLLFSKAENIGIFPYLFFGILFSLSVALLWELFEAGASTLLFVDMQEDTLLYSIKSFYLSKTHDHPMILEDITETVIYYGEGQILRIPGYLDLGLADTIADMAVCLLGNLAFLLLFPLDKLLGGRLLPRILPEIL